MKYRNYLQYLSLFLVAAISGFFIYNLYSNLPNRNQEKVTLSSSVPTDCNLQKSSCKVILSNSEEFSIEIIPIPVLSNTKHRVKIQLNSKNYKPIFLDINGKDMDMGFYRPDIQKLSDTQFEVSFELPVCTFEMFTWRFLLVFEKDKKRIGFPFYFEVKKS